MHAPEVPRRSAGPLLVPDLRPRPPRDVTLQRGRRGRWDLVFDTTVGNVGVGPLEIVPQSTRCRLDDGRRGGRVARQRVYHDVDRDGRYRRSVDTTYDEFEVGCFAYHRAHRHWHYEDLMTYELSDKDRGRMLTSSKMGFCLLDILPVGPRPSRRRYVGDRSGDITRLPCVSTTTQGLSPRWGDLYDAATTGQRVDVTNLPSGSYCISFVVSRDGALRERTRANNRAGTRVVLTRHQRARQVGRCSGPAPYMSSDVSKR